MSRIKDFFRLIVDPIVSKVSYRGDSREKLIREFFIFLIGVIVGSGAFIALGGYGFLDRGGTAIVADIRQAAYEATADALGLPENQLLLEVDIKEERDEIVSKEAKDDADVVLIPGKDENDVNLDFPDLSSDGKDIEGVGSEKSLTESGEDPITLTPEGGKLIDNCDFGTTYSPDYRVVFSEIAWMGGSMSSNDEWIELINLSNRDISLNGWWILNQDGGIEISFSETDNLSRGSFYLLERTDDNSVPEVIADKIYVGSLSNDGEWLKIVDNDCRLVDEIDASLGWDNFGGSQNEKKTLERNITDLSWQTSVSPYGTPKKPSFGYSSPSQSENFPPVDNQNQNPESQSTNQEPIIIVSEIMAGSSVSSNDEFVELFNFGTESVDLTGWSLRKKTSSGNENPLVTPGRLEGKIIPPGNFFLLAREGGYSGSVEPDVFWPASYSLAYTNNSIVLYSNEGVVIEEVSWEEITKDSSLEKVPVEPSGQFLLTSSPSPQNSSE